jgi:hypothetical protein
MVSFSMVGTNVSDKIDDSIFRLHVTLNRTLSTALLYSHILFFFENKSALYKNEETAHNYFYCCTVHLDINVLCSPTDALIY